jgi:hypothetical protein
MRTVATKKKKKQLPPQKTKEDKEDNGIRGDIIST